MAGYPNSDTSRLGGLTTAWQHLPETPCDVVGLQVDPASAESVLVAVRSSGQPSFGHTLEPGQAASFDVGNQAHVWVRAAVAPAGDVAVTFSNLGCGS
jgi:hypothetical protein